MVTTKFLVILGDVMESSDNPAVPELLHAAVQQINTLKSERWVAAFEITRGDEVAWIAKPGCNWFEILRLFNEKMAPCKLRWVVVYDELTGGLSYNSSAEAVGPAFIKADTLMRQLKSSSLFADIAIGSPSTDLYLKGAINLLLWRLYSLSPLQLAILRSYQKLRRQHEVAGALNKTQQQIQKSLKDIQWEIIDCAERAIDSYCADGLKEIV